MKRTWMLIAVLLAGCAGLGAQVAFQELNLEQALQRAGKENKMVFVDFFTTWCMPCKMMDSTTWKDAKVGAWLAKHTVAIRLDGDQESLAVKKYAVAGYPSMLFIGADGKILNRLMGFRDAAGFLSEAEAILSGEDPYARAKRLLQEEGEENLSARINYAGRLSDLNRRDEALAAYLWCYDKAVEKKASFMITMQIIVKLGSMARTMPAAREAVGKRLDQAVTSLDKEVWTKEQVSQVIDLSRFAGSDLAARLAVYDKLKPQAGPEERGRELAMLFMDELLEAKRYVELAVRLEPEKAADNILQELAIRQEWRKNNSQSPMYEICLNMIQGLIADASKHYEILLGNGQEAVAAALAEKLLTQDKAPSTLNALAWAGLVSGRAGNWHLQLAEKAWALSEMKDAGILDTYCRLLASFGELAKAEALITGFLKGKGDEPMKKTLEQCLDDIRRGLPPPRQ